MNNKHSVMLLITPCISKSQIVVHRPQFRFTEDFWWSVESWQLSWDWLHLLAASYFDRCPCSSLLRRDWRPLKAGGRKTERQTDRNQEHTAAAMQAKSADQQSHQLSLEIFLLRFGLPYFVLLHTSTPEKFAMLKSPISEKGYILAVPTICNLPAVQGLLLPVLRAGWKS